jgi:hypothetical protein
VAHDRDALCDSYIVSSIHDATESYYERGKHGLMDLNNIEFPPLYVAILEVVHILPSYALCFALS